MIAVAPSFDWQVPDDRCDTDCDMVENVPDNGEDGWSDRRLSFIAATRSEKSPHPLIPKQRGGAIPHSN